MSDDTKSTKLETKLSGDSQQFPWKKSWQPDHQFFGMDEKVNYESTLSDPIIRTIHLLIRPNRSTFPGPTEIYLQFILGTNNSDELQGFLKSKGFSLKKNTKNELVLTIRLKKEKPALDNLWVILGKIAKKDSSVEHIRQNILLDLDREYFQSQDKEAIQTPSSVELDSNDDNIPPMPAFNKDEDKLAITTVPKSISPHHTRQCFFTSLPTPSPTPFAPDDNYTIGAIQARLTRLDGDSKKILFEFALANAYFAYRILTAKEFRTYIFGNDPPDKNQIIFCKKFLLNVAKTHADLAEVILTTDALRERLLVDTDPDGHKFPPISEMLSEIAKSHKEHPDAGKIRALCEKYQPPNQEQGEEEAATQTVVQNPI